MEHPNIRTETHRPIVGLVGLSFDNEWDSRIVVLLVDHLYLRPTRLLHAIISTREA
jgi:hypothetical protein